MRIVGIAALTLVALFGPQMSAASADAASGKATYDRLCQACHQAGATGLTGAFPPLAGNPSVEDDAYMRDVLTNGLQGEIVVLSETYNGNMPAFPQLTEVQIADLLAYLRSLGSGPVSPPPPASPSVGDPGAGEALFLGSVRLANGGPACFGCHAAGSYGGGSLGPDLSGATAHLGGVPGLMGWLVAPPSPTMQPLFTNSPLTGAEIADLVAFIDSTVGTRPDGEPDWMLLGGLGGLAGLFGVMGFLFKRPRGTYVDRLRSRS